MCIRDRYEGVGFLVVFTAEHADVLCLALAVIPVSYTHLDVYKRQRLGHEPVRRSSNELWYLAPYRGERTPSFRVNVAKQLWYDFG